MIALHIEAIPCPLVVGRVLRLISRRALVPVDVAFEKGVKTVSINIMLDRAQFVPSRGFIDQLEGLPSVKWAEFLDHRGQALFTALPVARRRAEANRA